jgi:cytochrome c peroxidase
MRRKFRLSPRKSKGAAVRECGGVMIDSLGSGKLQSIQDLLDSLPVRLLRQNLSWLNRTGDTLEMKPASRPNPVGECPTYHQSSSPTSTPTPAERGSVLGWASLWLRPRTLIIAGGLGFLAPAIGLSLAFWGFGGRAGEMAQYRPPSFIPFPANNRFSVAKADLGRELFFDKRLSGSGTMACASCHQPDHAWTDGHPKAIGDDGHEMARRAPNLIDVAWRSDLGWDGRFPDIEAVTFVAIASHGNMNLSEPEALARISADPRYERAFAESFPDHKITAANVAAAIATFERLIVSVPNSPFDRWVAGDENAISEAAKRGFDLFNGRAHCAGCHIGWTFTDGSFHDVGSATGTDIGRGQYFSTSRDLQYTFKTPTLRDVAQRGPYMHDGSAKTLAEVIGLYNRGGVARPSRDALIKPLHLTAGEQAELEAFLETLSGLTSSSDQPPIPIGAPSTGQEGAKKR